MDPAETMRGALAKQHHAHRKYEEARKREAPTGESPEKRAKRLQDLPGKG